MPALCSRLWVPSGRPRLEKQAQKTRVMKSRWSEKEASEATSRWAPKWGEDLAIRTYSSRLLGVEKSLVLHGGGNTSVKSSHTNILGEELPALFIKASGFDLAEIEPAGHPALNLEYLKKLRVLEELSDEIMVKELCTHLLDSQSPTPSIETLVHAFVPGKFIDHTHADAILALTNQAGGEDLVSEALGEDVIVLGYVRPGFKLAQAVAEAIEAHPEKQAMVWMRHGLVTWAETARESYQATIELVSKAESFLARRAQHPVTGSVSTELSQAEARWVKVAPVLRGLLAEPVEDADRPYQRVILSPLINPDVLNFVDSDQGRELADTPPLTSDHLIRTKPFPLWVESPAYEDPSKLKDQMKAAVQMYRDSYQAYLDRNAEGMKAGLTRFDSAPRVILLPGMGVVCSGQDVCASHICRDITAQTLEIKARIGAMGNYEGMSESELFEMEYHTLQHAKLTRSELPLSRQVAVVTGAAGAIGSGLSRAFLGQGCHVAVTDLPGDRLDGLVEELRSEFGQRVLGVPLDVTHPDSIATAFSTIISIWGGVDLVLINAGMALVASLSEMNLDDFRRVQKVNVEGTLLVLAEAARHLELQGTGGDVVVISSKNVFAPGAQFGAYSATKAAAHQLARIASLELAAIDVRVNMVSPDAVFSEGQRKSGLWAEVGPDRMRARGLNEKELEEYYRNRNLLKAKVTASHVANAAFFFCTRQTPTTGVTLPVDGGLPEATPR
jgi:rhamnose utilization protein RhaD (predicted bifunctional aldolase and dehydrogenase)/NAD(P)-dependent dehydrogenase (short-subunit alcohol dehydrogenase family)